MNKEQFIDKIVEIFPIIRDAYGSYWTACPSMWGECRYPHEGLCGLLYGPDAIEDGDAEMSLLERSKQNERVAKRCLREWLTELVDKYLTPEEDE